MSLTSTNSPSSGLLQSETKSSNVEQGFVSDSIAAGMIFAIVLTIGQRAVGFGRGILFCRLMTDQQLGQWSMVWSYLMLLAPLAVLGLPGCFGKFTEYYRQRGQFKTFVSRIGIVSVITTTLVSGAIFVYPEDFSYMLFRDRQQIGLTRVLGLALIFVTASNFLGTLMESLRQVRVVTLMRFITGIAFAIIGTGLLFICQDSAIAATSAFAISCTIGAIPAVWILWKYREGINNVGEHLTQSTMWKRIAPFAAWLWVSNLLNNLIEVSDRYMLIHWSSTTAELAQGSVGQYHSGRVVPLLLVSVAVVIGGMLLPYMSQAWEAGNKRKAMIQQNLSIKLVALLFTAGSVLVLLLAPLLFDTILQGRYNDGLAVLPMTLVYCVWFGLLAISQEYLWVSEKGKWASLCIGIGLVLNIVLNMVLIPKYGLEGAVLATAAGNAAILITMLGINHLIGCKSDLGLWGCVALPLLLLAGPVIAIIALTCVIALGLFSNLVLIGDEKQVLTDLVKDKLGKRA